VPRQTINDWLNVGNGLSNETADNGIVGQNGRYSNAGNSPPGQIEPESVDLVITDPLSSGRGVMVVVDEVRTGTWVPPQPVRLPQQGCTAILARRFSRTQVRARYESAPQGFKGSIVAEP
jgi:hypothetical protein